MATGLNNKLTGQIGEHLATAELGRLGIIATPFSGNVPDIDILAHCNNILGHIQVKAINKDSWQFDVRKFLNIVLDKNEQKISGINKNLDRNIICIFILIGNKLGEDIFYIFKYGWLQDYFFKNYTARKAPKNINSFHCAIWTKDLDKFKNNWDLIKKHFKIK